MNNKELIIKKEELEGKIKKLEKLLDKTKGEEHDKLSNNIWRVEEKAMAINKYLLVLEDSKLFEKKGISIKMPSPEKVTDKNIISIVEKIYQNIVPILIGAIYENPFLKKEYDKEKSRYDAYVQAHPDEENLKGFFSPLKGLENFLKDSLDFEDVSTYKLYNAIVSALCVGDVVRSRNKMFFSEEELKRNRIA